VIVFHGTTHRRAERICEVGFLPRKPSRRVWFAKGRGYALRRARQQARRARDRPVVLTCDINISQFRERLGKKRVRYNNGVLAIDAPVPVSVLRSHPSVVGQPMTPEELAAWVNHLLGLKAYKGVSRRDPGIERLARWVLNRVTSQPQSRLRPGELLHMARQWLPEHFKGVEVDPKSLRAYRRVRQIDVAAGMDAPEPDPRDDEALTLLADPKPKRRIRGLAILADMEDPDLFEWCVMYLNDRSVNVRVAALHTMLRSEDGDGEVIAPLARSENKRVRAAAIAAMAKFSEDDAPRWFARGLKDPEPCVRIETAAVLSTLDPAEHRGVFELALYDPNPDVVRLAQKLTAGKGYPKRL